MAEGCPWTLSDSFQTELCVWKTCTSPEDGAARKTQRGSQHRFSEDTHSKKKADHARMATWIS